MRPIELDADKLVLDDEGAGSSDFAWKQMTYYDGWGYVLLRYVHQNWLRENTMLTIFLKVWNPE